MRIRVLTLGLLVAFAMLAIFSSPSESNPYEVVLHSRSYTCTTASGTECVSFFRRWTSTSTPDDKTGSAHPVVHDVTRRLDYQSIRETVAGDCDSCDS